MSNSPLSGVRKSIGMSTKKVTGLILLLVIIVGGGFASFGLFENVPAGYICVIQSPISGELTVYTEPGLKLQKFGMVTYYPRSGVYEFNQPVDPNDPSQTRYYRIDEDNALKITFNDGGEAWISGSIRYDYPLEQEKIKILHKMFSSHNNVMKGLIEKTVERSVYMSGPLMSSIESFMSRRAELPKLIEDQARNGLYDVVTKDTRIEDEFTKEIKMVKVAEPITDNNAPGGLKRQEESVLSKFGMSLSNFTTNNISYSPKVQQRVDALFAAASDIQVATLNAKKAEQDRKTAEEKGKAEAMAAEWKAKTRAAEETENARKAAEIQRIDAQRVKDVAIIEANKKREVAEQEKITASIVAEQEKEVALIEANRKREVAEQEKITASLYKDAQLLRAEADSTYKRKMMDADGALSQKLEAYKFAVSEFASAIKNYQGDWVPQIVSGGNGSSQTGNNAALNMMELLSIKAARDLSIDLNTQNKNANK